MYLAAGSPLIPTIIDQFHGSAHEGFVKTLQRVRSNFYWICTRHGIINFIKNCDICQRNKVEQQHDFSNLFQLRSKFGKTYPWTSLMDFHLPTGKPRPIVCDRNPLFTVYFGKRYFIFKGQLSILVPAIIFKQMVIRKCNRTLEMFHQSIGLNGLHGQSSVITPADIHLSKAHPLK